MCALRLILRLEPTSAPQGLEDPGLGQLQEVVAVLHAEPGSVLELTYHDTRLVIRALEGHRYIVEYSHPAVGTWAAGRRVNSDRAPVSLHVGGRERLIPDGQLLTGTEAQYALEDFVDGGGTRSGRLAWWRPQES